MTKYVVSLVYIKSIAGGIKNLLNTSIISNATSEEEALGFAINAASKDKRFDGANLNTFAVTKVEFNEENKEDSSSDQHADKSQQG